MLTAVYCFALHDLLAAIMLLPSYMQYFEFKSKMALSVTMHEQEGYFACCYNVGASVLVCMQCNAGSTVRVMNHNLLHAKADLSSYMSSYMSSAIV